MANQVTIVAILMIVQGALECIMGLINIAMGPFISTFLAQNMKNQPGAQPLPPSFTTFFSAYYYVLGSLVLCVGLFTIVAGIRNLKYRGRGLGIAAMICGVVSWLTCYCAPTSIALMIYGLIVYLNEDARRAFAMGERGESPEQIKAAFSQDRPQYDDFDEDRP